MQRREFMGTCAAVGAVGSAETVSVRPGADDTSAIQAAIDAVGQAGGGTVQFATGVYPLQKPLVVRHDFVRLVGASRGAILKATDWARSPAAGPWWCWVAVSAR